MGDTSPRQTPSTLLSTDQSSFTSASDHPTASTALTSPNLASPRKNNGRLEPLLSVFEGSSVSTESSRQRRDMDVTRGPSVRQRASQFEHFDNQAEASSSRHPMGIPIGRTRSTSPLRINRQLPAPRTPMAQRRIPVPSTAPPRTTLQPDDVSPKRRKSPPKLSRGSTKKMVQQWENLPAVPNEKPRLVSGHFSRQYLDEKPLPSPAIQPITNYSTPGRAHQPSPSRRNVYSASPLHLQTPRRVSSSLDTSPSSWSLSPSIEKRKKGRSPLKEMLTVFGGGVLRKVKGKSKDKGWKGDYVASVGLDRVGSNGLPGGIVFHDRMGDQEMSPVLDSDAIRSSAIIYLIPTPCSSVSPWGSWLTSWGSLTSTHLKVTYCPIFQDPQAGHQTPKRVFSGASQGKGGDPNFMWSSVPTPSLDTTPDVEMSMKDCVEVRSLRREEVKGRGVPAVPSGAGTEVLEMVWSDGSKRYIGVEGVAGRLGWVSAIWDVLLACKANGMPALPPPSPSGSPRPSTGYPLQPISEPIETFVDALLPPGRSTSPRQRVSSGSTLKASRGDSSAPPVQKIGDRWVAASTLGHNDSGSIKREERTPGALRESVKRMFEAGPDHTTDEPMDVSSNRGLEVNKRIMTWQPVTERELSIFSRTGSRRSEQTVGRIPFTEIDRANQCEKTGSELSFDPNDLNPSRSASQVGRRTDSKKILTSNLNAVDEDVMMDRTTILPDPTHVSRVTFPKPTVAGHALATAYPARGGGLETIPSVAPSSIETDEQTIRTPHNEPDSTNPSSLDHSVIAKLEKQSIEHGTLTRQIDSVHVDVRQVILNLSTLAAATRSSAAETETRIPKALDDRLSTIGMDVKAIENALNLSQLLTNRLSASETTTGPSLLEVHEKLDAIAKLCEDVLAKSASSGIVPDKTAEGGQSGGADARLNKLGIMLDSDEEKSAGHEVAQIMADVTGGSSKTSPRLGGLQVLHNISNPGTPRPSAPCTPVTDPLSENVTKQVGEVLSLVTELRDARTLQTQQTTDIARYLNELNSWLEKFVLNSTNEISSLSKKLTAIVGTDPESNPGVEKQFGLPDLVADIHSMVTEQKKRVEIEGTSNSRLDSLLNLMGQERERSLNQSNMVESVIGVLERQRGDNEILLRALATDLTAEIRGERLRFVEAMQQATTMNISVHVEEFKKLLGAEVGKAMKELGELREERKTLEHQISDLFALKAKHGGNSRKSAVVGKPVPAPGAAGAGAAGPPSPATSHAPTFLGLPSPIYGMRNLPSPPGR